MRSSTERGIRVRSSPPQKTLLGALFVGGIPLLMGAAAFYFTSGVTVHCKPNGSGHAACTENRRVLKLIDVPLRRYPDVLGAESYPRRAYDSDGDPYTVPVPVLLTPGGKKELALFGEGADFGGLVAGIDAYAKDPNPRGLTVGGQAGGLLFFFHLFSTIFILSGVTTFYGYIRQAFRHSAG
jgi:hypothetical protein